MLIYYCTADGFGNLAQIQFLFDIICLHLPEGFCKTLKTTHVSNSIRSGN